MIFVQIFMVIIGVLFVYIGWRIWKKEQITLIHSYHYEKVSEKNKKPYTEKMGKATILMGVGIALTGIADFIFHTSYSWCIFAICFIGGLVVMIISQIKYNHGIF